MRVARAIALSTVLVSAVTACSADTEEPPASDAPSFGDSERSTFGATGQQGGDAGASAPQPGKQTAEPPPATAPGIDPETASHPEVVYVLMDGKDGLIWFCTGALVSKTVVVTAAHCLQSKLFTSWEVVAPTLPNAPRVKATSVAMYDPSWNDVSHPDLGIVRLSAPIDLPRYAVPTDVSARVDSGQPTQAAAIVRKAEQPEAPFRKTDAMKVTSTVGFGYTHGYGVPMFSHGGDSGAGLFLVENGQMTHQLIGVERQPDPARKLDHLSRIEPAFIQWLANNGT